MKTYRTAAVLALIVFALGGLATWDEWKSKQEEAESKTKNRLSEAKAEDVVEIEYASKGLTAEAPEGEAGAAPDAAKAAATPVAMTLAKQDGVWRVVKPVEALAEEAAVTSLIKTLLEYSYGQVVAESADKWAEFGLKDPQRTVTLKFAEGKGQPLSLYIGDKAPVGYNVYVRTSQGDKSYMGSQYLLTSTSKTLFEMRDKALVKVEAENVKQLTYEKAGGSSIELDKGADGKFSITKPEALEADTAEVRDFVESLSRARATAFHDQPAADLVAAFAAPAYKIGWQDSKGQATSLLFAEHGGKLMAAVDPAKRVLELPDELKATVNRDLTSFRNRRVLAVDASDLATLDIDGTSYKLVNGDWYAAADAAKLDENGKVVGGNEKDKPQEKAHVRAFVVDVEFAKTDAFLAPGDAAVAKLSGAAPEHKITLGFKKAETAPVTIELFRAEDAADKYLVRRSGAPVVYRIAKSAFASMTPGGATESKAPAVEPDESQVLPGGHDAGMPEDLDEGMLNDDEARGGDMGTG